ncbi:MAG: prepilin-type N-terminal cleavage/methylation domain-containing protein [Pseudanabaena sp.]|jgi:prepilin-type N-terminal cleavage/methylation domain-containing protein
MSDLNFQDIKMRSPSQPISSWFSQPSKNLSKIYLSVLSEKRRSTDDSSSEAGFTLLESLVAAAVVGILIVSIAPMVALSTSARINARRIDQATQAARSYVDAVRGGVIDVTRFPDTMVVSTPNAQSQYTFEGIVPPTATLLTLDSATATTPVRGIRIDADGNGFNVDDPQDLVIQPMRSGPLGSSATAATDLQRQGFWLAVRVYRADAFAGGNALRTGTEIECAQSKTPFASTASIVCPLITIRSQILPSVNSNNLDDIKTGIGSTN